MPRTLAVGDIHGCLTAFNTLLEFVDLRADDRLITLGDYVDRGPDSKGVLDRLIQLDASHQLVPLRGNHEIMMLHAQESRSEFQLWKAGGGDAVLLSYGLNPHEGPDVMKLIPTSHWSFLKGKLLPFHETESHFFVHANADPHLELIDQPDYILYWEKFSYPVRHQSGKRMICGHTSQKCGLPLNTPDAVCIDTWAFGNGWLSCLDIDSETLWQSNQLGETRRMQLSDC